MSLTLLLLQLALSATPSSTVVVVTRRTAVSPADARAVAVGVTKSLKQAGLEVAWDADAAARRLGSLGVKDTSSCQGRKACVQEFGRQLDVAVVIGVSLSEVDTDRSVALEAVRVLDGVVLAHENLLYARSAAPPADQLTLFTTHLKAALAPPSTGVPVATDVPARPPPALPSPLEPAPAPLSPAPAPVVIREAPPRSHVGGLVVGGAAVLTLAAAVTLGVLALGAKGDLSRGTTLPDGRVASSLTGSEAASVSRRANNEFYGAVGCAAAGVALGTTAVVLW